MSEQKKPTAKKIIEFIIVLLTAVLSFLGGNVSAQNGYKLLPTEKTTEINNNK